jgi:hypothetical protein
MAYGLSLDHDSVVAFRVDPLPATSRPCQMFYSADAKSSATFFNGEPFPRTIYFEQAQG